VIPFRVSFRPGVAVCEQVIYAAKKAIISGQLRSGASFPSVRALSTELKINPNTAHKAVAELTAQGLIEVVPGVGTVVAAGPSESTAKERARLVGSDVERLVVEAKQMGLELDDLIAAVSKHWEALRNPESKKEPVKK
jgi:GntR family transcriptional regulator